MLLCKSDLVPESWADLTFGLLAISLFFVGDWAWDVRRETGAFFRPLTLWALAVLAALTIATVWRWWRDRGERGLTWQQPIELEPVAS